MRAPLSTACSWQFHEHASHTLLHTCFHTGKAFPRVLQLAGVWSDPTSTHGYTDDAFLPWKACVMPAQAAEMLMHIMLAWHCAGRRRGGVTVWFFDTREMQCLPPEQVTPFGAGLAAGLHAKCKRSVKAFRRALCEANEYLQVGLGVFALYHVLKCVRQHSPNTPSVCHIRLGKSHFAA